MTLRVWDWPLVANLSQRGDRFSLMRAISYEVIPRADHDEDDKDEPTPGLSQKGKALSLNISSGGMLLLMDRAPEPDRIFKVHMPTPVNFARIPTLAEVRWIRKIPYEHAEEQSNGLYFVGLKFAF